MGRKKSRELSLGPQDSVEETVLPLGITFSLGALICPPVGILGAVLLTGYAGRKARRLIFGMPEKSEETEEDKMNGLPTRIPRYGTDINDWTTGWSPSISQSHESPETAAARQNPTAALRLLERESARRHSDSVCSTLSGLLAARTDATEATYEEPTFFGSKRYRVNLR